MQNQTEVENIRLHFKQCTHVLAAIGDETRQLIVLALAQGGCDGLRVGEITAATHLSRPAVSHHLKVLKEAGIVRLYKEKTMNYYYLDPTGWITNLKHLVLEIEDVVKNAMA